MENLGKTRIFPLSKEQHMTQDETIEKERFFNAKNGTSFKIKTVPKNSGEASSFEEKYYSRFRDIIKGKVESFLYIIWNPRNPTSKIASYEEIERMLQDTTYFQNWREILLGLFNILQSIEALLHMEFIPESTAISLSGNAIFPILMVVAELKKVDSLIDDALILSERIKELEDESN